jgi:hypothetical protein
MKFSKIKNGKYFFSRRRRWRDCNLKRWQFEWNFYIKDKKLIWWSNSKYDLNRLAILEISLDSKERKKLFGWKRKKILWKSWWIQIIMYQQSIKSSI